MEFICNQCGEWFELLGPHSMENANCPRCASRDVKEVTAKGPEVGPPPWMYLCQQCGGRFRLKAPSGPSEEKEVRCPRCGGRDVQWLINVGEACPPGG